MSWNTLSSYKVVSDVNKCFCISEYSCIIRDSEYRARHLLKAGKSVKQTNLQIIRKIGGWALLPGNELPGIRA